MRIGWMLRMLPGAYLCAEHHAVWETPAGQVVDVTEPSNSSLGPASTTFLLDERVKVDPNRTTPNVRSRFVPLTDSGLTKQFITRYEEFHGITQRALDAYSAGDMERFEKADHARNLASVRMVRALERLEWKALD